MKIDLGIHEIAGQYESFGRLNAAFLDAQNWFQRSLITNRKYPQSVYQPVVVEPAVCNARVVGISQKVVHAIDAEGISDDDLR